MSNCNCPVTQPGPTLASTCGGVPFMLFMGLLEVFLRYFASKKLSIFLLDDIFYFRSQCDLEDPCGRPHSTETLSEYDFIVVGAGSAGSVVASRLSEVPEWNVLLIEAGNLRQLTQKPSIIPDSLRQRRTDWHPGTVNVPEFPRLGHRLGVPNRAGKKRLLGGNGSAMLLAQGKSKKVPPDGVFQGFHATFLRQVMGGTSTMNGMMYMRGSRKDYDDWAAMGNEGSLLVQKNYGQCQMSNLIGWSYNDVLPYFLKSEDNKQVDKMDRGYHSEGGLLQVSQFPYHPPLSRAIIKAAEELGHPIRDVNGIYHTGFQIAQTTNRNGSRLSASRAFVRPFKNRKNLDIVMNATVTKVLVSPQTKQAYGVELLRDGNLVNIYSTKEVIVSGGE